MRTAPELLREQMPLVRRINADLTALGYVKGSEEFIQVFNHMIAYYRKFGWTTQGEIK